MVGVALMAAAALAPAANGRIAFTSFRDGGTSRIYTMNPDGSDQRAVTAGPDAQSDWAPDGRALAFRRGTTSDYEVWVAGADGAGAHPVTASPAGESATQPGWLPDGSGRLLYRRVFGSDSDIWRTDNTPLVTVPGHQWYPSASPADGRLLFATTISGDDRAIQTAAPDGSDVRTIRDLSGVYDSAPAWSPDGERIAFESDADGDMEIYVMRPDGGDVRQLTRNGEHDEGPNFSPDGTRIVFTRGENDVATDVWTMAADGSDQRRLTDAAGRDESPDWQPVPAGGSPPPPSGGGGTPAPTPPGVGPRRVRLRLAGRTPRLRTARRRGLRLRATVPARTRATFTARARSRRVGRRRTTLRAGTTTLRLRLSKRLRSRTVRVRLATPAGSAALTLRLRR